jgi:hypothetical protein
MKVKIFICSVALSRKLKIKQRYFHIGYFTEGIRIWGRSFTKFHDFKIYFQNLRSKKH